MLSPEATMPPEVTCRKLEAVATPARSRSTPQEKRRLLPECGQNWLCDLCGLVQNENAGPLFKITNNDQGNRAGNLVQRPGRHGARCDCSGHSP